MKVMTTSADAPIFSASAHRVRYLRIISILGFITATILVPMHILWGLDVLAIVCGTFAATCIFVIMMLQKRPDAAPILANLLVLATMLVAVGATFFQTADVMIDPWAVLFIAVAYALCERKTALKWSVVATVFMLSMRYFQAFSVSPLSTALLAMAMLVTSLVLYLYTDQIEINERLIVQLGNTDALTKTLNRHSLDDLLHTEFRRNARQGTSMTVFMLDVDSFKLYNDHYGHIHGDKVLVRIAEALKATAKRSGDYVFRYGGEEFLVLCSGLEQAQSAAFAERLRANVEILNIDHETSRLGKVSVSIGYQHADSLTGLTAESMIEAADKALYRAKANGRNRVETLVSVSAA